MNSLNKRAVVEGLEKARKTGAKAWRDNLPTWCPGCGHFTVLHGLYESLKRLEIPSKDVVVVSGIGCSGRFPFFIKGFGFHSLHGRAIPVATGIKLANPELTVIVIGGDGDGMAIGGGHFPHAARNNLDITYIMMDNSIYGLTKGQVSPTSPLEMKSGTSPYGNIARPLNPSTLALAYGATFVARSFSREKEVVVNTITNAIRHKGFSFVHDISPCVEFNKTVTYGSVNEKIEKLPEDYKGDSRPEAILKANSTDPVYMGIYLQEAIPTLHDNSNRVIESLK
ncbi:MAG: 2-oxoacid:ferredoxin oxidoreductase subunit beta [bacterium]|nr:2-oxoacid:ferredoxin oxidoreductase subunit beta [bacterium]